MDVNVTATSEQLQKVKAVIAAGQSAIGRSVPGVEQIISDLLCAIDLLHAGSADRVILRKSDDQNEG